MKAISYEKDLEVVIAIEEKFSHLDEKKFIELFKQRQEEGYIRKEFNLYDNKWIIKVKGEEKVLDFMSDVQLKKLSNKLGLNTIHTDLGYRSFILYELNRHTQHVSFNNFMKRFINDNYNSLYGLKFIVLNYFRYMKISDEKYKEFKSILSYEDAVQYEKRKEINRKLPKFRHVFLFSDIVNFIIENESLINYKDFLLTILWWKITSVLPLRPTEFLRTKFNCIYTNEVGDSYYLKVMRTNGKKDELIENRAEIDKYYFEDTIKIDRDLFDLIDEYRDILVNDIGYTENAELFPRMLLDNGCSYITAKSKAHKFLNKDLVVLSDLRLNIDKFYKLIENKYKLVSINKKNEDNDLDLEDNYIQKITPSDTRELAIINMIAMGVPVERVMCLADHESIDITMGYYNKFENAVHGYALGFADYIKEKNRTEYGDGIIKSKEMLHLFNQNKHISNSKLQRVIKTINIDDESNSGFTPKRVIGGVCTYKNIESDFSHCYRYEGNHNLCEYFREDAKECLLEEIDNTEKKLSTDIKLLFDLVRDYDGVAKFHELCATTSYRIAKEMNNLVVLDLKLNESEE